MRIALGTSIDATWTDVIVYSTSDSGNYWKSLYINNISIDPTVIQPAFTGGGSAVKPDNQYKIRLTDNGTGRNVLEFLLSEITNQAGWTNNMTGLIQAHSDIASWIGTAAGSSVTVTSLPTASPTSSASAAATQHRTFGLDATPVAIKASAGNLYGYNIVNVHSYAIYVKFCDLAAASVVVGTTPVVRTIRVPANGQVYQDPSSVQLRFGTAMSVYATRYHSDTDATAITSTRVIFEALYE